jgi:hypothetical protein
MYCRYSISNWAAMGTADSSGQRASKACRVGNGKVLRNKTGMAVRIQTRV